MLSHIYFCDGILSQWRRHWLIFVIDWLSRQREWKDCAGGPGLDHQRKNCHHNRPSIIHNRKRRQNSSNRTSKNQCWLIVLVCLLMLFCLLSIAHRLFIIETAGKIAVKANRVSQTLSLIRLLMYLLNRFLLLIYEPPSTTPTRCHFHFIWRVGSWSWVIIEHWCRRKAFTTGFKPPQPTSQTKSMEQLQRRNQLIEK